MPFLRRSRLAEGPHPEPWRVLDPVGEVAGEAVDLVQVGLPGVLVDPEDQPVVLAEFGVREPHPVPPQSGPGADRRSPVAGDFEDQTHGKQLMMSALCFVNGFAIPHPFPLFG